jgi:hypothetical protein
MKIELHVQSDSRANSPSPKFVVIVIAIMVVVTVAFLSQIERGDNLSPEGVAVLVKRIAKVERAKVDAVSIHELHARNHKGTGRMVLVQYSISGERKVWRGYRMSKPIMGSWAVDRRKEIDWEEWPDVSR